MWGLCNGSNTTIVRLQHAQLAPCRQDGEAAAGPSGSHLGPHFSFPQLDHRPESSDITALLHASSSLQSHGEAASSHTPSTLARSLSPRSARLMAAVLAAAGDDELIQVVARAHSSKAVPPLAHTLRHRLQEPFGAEGEAQAAAGTDHILTLGCTGMALAPHQGWLLEHRLLLECKGLLFNQHAFARSQRKMTQCCCRQRKGSPPERQAVHFCWRDPATAVQSAYHARADGGSREQPQACCCVLLGASMQRCRQYLVERSYILYA